MNKPSEMRAYSFLRITSWATYDLANTIFSINILSLYFPLWVIEKGGSDFLYAAASSASLLLASCFMPFLGTLSDHLKRRMIFLIPTTLLCVLATAFLSNASSLKEGIFFFCVAHIGYQWGLLFYDALLFHVAGSRALGKISGLGVALGYCGTLIGLLVARPFVLTQGYQAVFLPTSLSFLIFSLPCFWFVRDEGAASLSVRFSLFRETQHRFKKGFGHFKKGTPLYHYLWIYFFALLAIQPVILFMSVYTHKVIGLDDRQMLVFFFLTTFLAIFGSFLTGILTDRFGPRNMLLFSLGSWCLGLLGAVLFSSKPYFWGVGGILGIAMGSIWVAHRVLVIHLSSPDYLAETFGCVGFIGRLAAIAGPLFWGGVTWGLRDYFPANYQVALLFLLFWMLISLTLLMRRLPPRAVLGPP